MLQVEMLPANEGDALWVEYGETARPRRMVVDAGRKETYRELANRVGALDRAVDLLVLTHIDDDHIYGAVPLFADQRVNRGTFKDVWYNGYTHLDHATARRPAIDTLGPVNGEVLAALLLRGCHPWNEAFDAGATVVVPATGRLPRRELPGNMTLTLLSPSWDGLSALRLFWEHQLDQFQPGDPETALAWFSERRALQPDVLGSLLDVEGLLEGADTADSTEPNGSSIAFLAEHDGLAVLFTGDAHPAVLVQSITRLLEERGQRLLRLDALKVAHHGSKNNTSRPLLARLDCRRFLFSTNGARHGHPDPECIARIVAHNRGNPEPTELYFNFRTKQNGGWDDPALKEEWNYQTHYPPAGCRLRLPARC
jgi:beta-lactamase superfamily II metal-dependent hydrolase